MYIVYIFPISTLKGILQSDLIIQESKDFSTDFVL